MTQLRASQLASTQLSALYEVCSILNHSLDYQSAVERILAILHNNAMLETPMLVLHAEDEDKLELNHVYIPEQGDAVPRVHYKMGEGIIGNVMSTGESIVIPLISEDMRFTDKLELYNWAKPFVAVPVKSGGKKIIGVLAAQPNTTDRELLAAFNQFMEMCANLIGQKVALSRNIANQQSSLQTERDQLRNQMKSNYRMDNLVGHSQPMKQIFEQIRMVSKWDSTVLLRGESGTGKELIANAIHYNSSRATGPFIKLNCAALPDNLLESELFGHEKAHLPVRSNNEKAGLKWLMAALCFWMKLVKFLRHFRPNYCGFCRKANLNESAEPELIMLMSA